jgi:Polysaccharide deacetylase
MSRTAIRWRRVIGVTATWLVVVAAVAVPVAVARHVSRNPERSSPTRAQITTAAPMLDNATVAQIEAFDADRWDAPLILSYHDIRADEPDLPAPNRYTVSPETFAGHVATLRRLGFRSMSVAEFLAWDAGEPLDGPRVLLTFDDGPSGLWRHADPILRDAGMTAVAFVITGSIGTTKYYLNWSEVAAMQASGRWDFAGHTADQHTKHPSDVVLGGESQVVRRSEGESISAGVLRVAADLDAMSAAMVEHGLPIPAAFSWPFSMTENQADPEFAAAVVELVSERFPLNFTNAVDGQPLLAERGVTAPRPRLELLASVSAADLAATIVWFTPLSGEIAVAQQPALWMVVDRRLVDNALLAIVPAAADPPPVTFTNTSISVAASDSYSLITFASRQSPAPSRRAFRTTVSGLLSGRNVQIRLSQPATDNSRAVVLKAGSWSVVEFPTETVLRSGTLASGDARRVEIVDDGESYTLQIDDVRVARLDATPASYDTVALGVGVGDSSIGSARAVTFTNPTLELDALQG